MHTQGEAALGRALRYPFVDDKGGSHPGNQLPLEIHIGSWRRGLTYREAMMRLEREFLTRVLAKTGGCRRRAAERLQVSYSTLKYRLRKLALGDSGRGHIH